MLQMHEPIDDYNIKFYINLHKIYILLCKSQQKDVKICAIFLLANLHNYFHIITRYLENFRILIAEEFSTFRNIFNRLKDTLTFHSILHMLYLLRNHFYHFIVNRRNKQRKFSLGRSP